MKLYQLLAQKIAWEAKEDFREQRRRDIDACLDLLPSGSGWDNGTKLDEDATRENRLVFYGGFHHMDTHGYYCGWTEHQVIVTPSLCYELDIRVTGINRNDVKEDIRNRFEEALKQRIDFVTMKVKANG